MLPDKLSDLLEVAVQDLKSVIAKPEEYVVDMRAWFQTGKLCRVCLAGSMLTQTVQMSKVDAEDFVRLKLSGTEHCRGNEICLKLLAVDCVRQGYFDRAMFFMGDLLGFLRRTDEVDLPIPCDFQADPNEFCEDILYIAKQLRLIGY